MELVSYLRARPRRLAALVLLPLLVAVAAAIISAAVLPARHEGALEIALPPTASPGLRTVDEQLANFLAAAQGTAVTTSVGDRTGLTADAVKAGLVLTRLQTDGSYVQIGFTGESSDVVRKVVALTAVKASRAIMGPQIQAAVKSRDDLMSQYQQVQDDQAPTTTPTIGLSADEVVRRQQESLLDSAGAANGQRAALIAQRDTLINQADPGAVIVSDVSPIRQVAQIGLVSGGIALFVVIGVLTLLDLVRPANRRSVAS